MPAGNLSSDGWDIIAPFTHRLFLDGLTLQVHMGQMPHLHLRHSEHYGTAKLHCDACLCATTAVPTVPSCKLACARSSRELLPVLIASLSLQGHLPDSWASWAHLRFVSIGDPAASTLQSTLPAAWGAEGAFPQLNTVRLP